ncbi:hypothetical protein Tco_0564215 [Tanacetum coccineum]
METRFQDTERMMMTALEMVNIRKDRAAVRAEIEVLRRERLTYEQESMETRQAFARSEAYCRALEARVTVLEIEKMAPKRATRSTPVTTTPAPTAATTTTVTNAQLQAMIDQGVSAALAARDATRNGTDSHSSGTGVRGSERVARECTYQDFMKCKPLYFKGTEGVVELTQWFERMETVFRISNCSVENQVKFSTCTLLASALTWWNSHFDPENYIRSEGDSNLVHNDLESKEEVEVVFNETTNLLSSSVTGANTYTAPDVFNT